MSPKSIEEYTILFVKRYKRANYNQKKKILLYKFFEFGQLGYFQYCYIGILREFTSNLIADIAQLGSNHSLNGIRNGASQFFGRGFTAQVWCAQLGIFQYVFNGTLDKAAAYAKGGGGGGGRGGGGGSRDDDDQGEDEDDQGRAKISSVAFSTRYRPTTTGRVTIPNSSIPPRLGSSPRPDACIHVGSLTSIRVN